MTFKTHTHGLAPRPRRRTGADAARPPPGMPRYLRAATGMPVHGAAPLPVSSPGDACEREADAVARRLAGAPEGRDTVAAGAPLVPAQRTGDATRGADAIMPTGAAAGQGGAALPDSLSALYGARLGHDLSGVRVHTDGSAAAAARETGARAYTVGADIVFGGGEYAPGTPHGDRLIAHEAAHVVQQARSGRPSLMREPAPEAPQPKPAAQPTPAAGGLDALPAATRQALKVDIDEAHGADPKNFFGLQGTIVTANNVDIDYELVTPGIDALKDDKAKSALYKGLRAYALGVFDLVPDDKGQAATTRLNLVHHVNLDLAPWKGPNAAFRFTAIGNTAVGKIKVKVLVEQLGAPFEPMSAGAAGVEAAKATPNALVKNALLPDATWQRVLRALDRMPAATLARIHDIEFDISPEAKAADGEDAQYLSTWKDGKWMRRIVLYADLRKGGDEQFAFTLIHEIGHALDFAPTQGAKGPEAGKEAHADPAFKDAAQKDGGRAKAITAYGAKSDKEFYAECFAMVTQHPATLKALRPNIHAYFAAAAGPAAAPAAKSPAAP